MQRRHGWSVLLAGLLGALLLAGCNGKDDGAEFRVDHYFGNGFKDTTPVVAKVGDVSITERDIELRYQELPQQLKSRFSGPEWKQMLLHYMIQEALLAQQAVADKVYLDPRVAQQLISLRRSTLIDGYRDMKVYKEAEPTEDQVIAYYKLHQDELKALPAVKARHIQCNTEEEARKAYDQLMHGKGRDAKFPYVVAIYSRNETTAKRAGDLGWFNRGGFIDGIPYYAKFTDTVFDWPVGIHEPVKIGTDWHVVEILQKRPERPLTLDEARDQIVQKLKPQLQRQKLEETLAQLRRQYGVTYFGEYRPGKGIGPEALIKRAMLTRDPDKAEALYDMVAEDFPETEYAPMALFMKANLVIDYYGDTNRAKGYLRRMLREYPDTNLRDQAEFMLEHMDELDFHSPTSIEELRRLGK